MSFIKVFLIELLNHKRAQKVHKRRIRIFNHGIVPIESFLDYYYKKYYLKQQIPR